MKKILSILILTICFYNNSLKAQGFGLQVGLINPLGRAAYFLKPGLGAELHFIPADIDDRWKFNIALSYYVFKPTQDTFNTYGLEVSQQSKLYPGYSIISKVDMASICMGVTFKILDKKLSPTVGTDLIFSMIGISQTVESGFRTTSSENESYWSLALAPRIGASYEVSDNWLINAGLAIPVVGIGSTYLQSYWKPFISINYFID